MQDKTSDAEAKAKFDLDVVNIPKAHVNETEPPAQEPQIQTEPETVSDAVKPAFLKKIYRIPLFLVTVFLLTFSILWTTGVIQLPGDSEEDDASTTSGLYVHVGPVSVTNDNIRLKLTLTIKCRSAESKEKAINMSSIIKDKLVGFLSTPDMYQIISRRDYDHLKIKLKSMFNDALGEHAIENVYFAELILY